VTHVVCLGQILCAIVLFGHNSTTSWWPRNAQKHNLDLVITGSHATEVAPREMGKQGGQVTSLLLLRHLPQAITVTRTGEEEQSMIAIDILRWPGVNQAFLFSFFVTTAMALVVIPIGKRRPIAKAATWGEAMIGSVYTFFVMFLAFGVVPHQFIDHADKELGWRKDKLLYGPFDILNAKANGGNFPFTLSYEAIRDIAVVVIHVYFIGLMIYMFVWWQKRGEKVTKEIETSSYGRPLVRKS
jgi:hypothetical protein